MAEGLKLISVREEHKLESEFSELYINIIADLYNLKSHNFLNEVKKALKDIRRLKHYIGQWDEIVFFEKIKFENCAVRCAYMYSYSVLHTIVVYSVFLKYLKSNENVFIKLFSKKVLKICCLAGGPATEAVAVSKAISDFLGKYSKEDNISLIDVQVTVVDICSEWKSEEDAVINALNKTSDLFHSKRMHFSACFLKADLLKPFEVTLKEKIEEANIITIVKFANTILEESRTANCFPHLRKMVKDVIKSMDEDGCLFVLDTAGGKMFSNIKSVFSDYRSSFHPQDSLHKRYRLHSKTLQRMESAMNFTKFSETPILLPTVLTRVSSSIWIKKVKFQKNQRPKSKTNQENSEKIQNQIPESRTNQGNPEKIQNQPNPEPTRIKKKKLKKQLNNVELLSVKLSFQL